MSTIRFGIRRLVRGIIADDFTYDNAFGKRSLRWHRALRRLGRRAAFGQWRRWSATTIASAGERFARAAAETTVAMTWHAGLAPGSGALPLSRDFPGLVRQRHAAGGTS